MKYPVVANCGVDGVTYKEGDTIDMEAIHEGSRQSLLRLGVLGDPLPENKTEEPPKVEQPANDPPPEEKPPVEEKPPEQETTDAAKNQPKPNNKK